MKPKVLFVYRTFTHAAQEQGVSRQAVRKWASGGVPAERVIEFCRRASWNVTPHRVRPDIYPNPCDGLPAGMSVGPMTTVSAIEADQV